MFGKILSFDKNFVIVENTKGIADTNYIGLHAVFEEPDHKVVGEIVSLSKEDIRILLIGELEKGTFSNGVLKMPGINTIARVIFKSELEAILGKQAYEDKDTLLIGTSPIYKDYYVTSNLNEFLSNHFAIIGNTGSGKSCSLARLFQNIFYASTTNIPKNAHICLFDAYGEYYNAFDPINNIPGLHFKKYTTQIDFGDSDLLRIPAYFLESDDLAILLGATSASQLPLLNKAIELAKIFKSNDPKAVDHKNNIIAKCLLDILSSGKSPTQARDQIITVLSAYNTESLSLDSMIRQPGYDRTLRQCLNIDDQGKMNAINLVVDYLNKFVKVDMTDELVDGRYYSLEDLYYALEFALINEGSLNSSDIYDKNNILKGRLFSIINSPLSEYFKYDKEINKDQFVNEFFKDPLSGENSQLVDINLSYLEDRFAKCITKIFSKLFFEYTTNLEKRGTYSVHIVLEEAHRYVQNDSDIDVIGYNIFDRITKEGRKYGTIIGFITQRPNELSKTALSQCSNFVVFRLFYPDDLNIVKGISSNVTNETVEKIKTLHPGMGLVFGTAFKIPVLVNFPLPNPLPISTSLKIDDIWY